MDQFEGEMEQYDGGRLWAMAVYLYFAWSGMGRKLSGALKHYMGDAWVKMARKGLEKGQRHDCTNLRQTSDPREKQHVQDATC